jgi:hypothetical protein
VAADHLPRLAELAKRARRALARVEALAIHLEQVRAEASDLSCSPRGSGPPAASRGGPSDPTGAVAVSGYHARLRRELRRLERTAHRAERELEEALARLEAAVVGDAA